MKNELPTYYILSSQMAELDDMYSLCFGLLKTNPSDENISSCNLVFKEIKRKTAQIEDQCPYISFYVNYLK